MSADIITDLLNRVSAVIKAQVSSFKELATDTGIPIAQLYDLVNLRRNRPNGKRAVLLHVWAEQKSNQIAMLPRKIQRQYREAYEAVCQKFPVEGKEMT